MKQHVKSICAALLCVFPLPLLVFVLTRAVDWNQFDHPFPLFLGIYLYIGSSIPLYYAAKKRVEKRWTFRGAIFVFAVALFFIIGSLFNGWVDDGSYVVFGGYCVFLVMLLLFDLLMELVRHIMRRICSRSA